jgi:hypothetical protein
MQRATKKAVVLHNFRMKRLETRTHLPTLMLGWLVILHIVVARMSTHSLLKEPGDQCLCERQPQKRGCLSLRAKEAGGYLAVVDFVAVKASKSHKGQYGSGGAW